MMTYVRLRRIFGKPQAVAGSRFLREIDGDLLETEDLTSGDDWEGSYRVVFDDEDSGRSVFGRRRAGRQSDTDPEEGLRRQAEFMQDTDWDVDPEEAIRRAGPAAKAFKHGQLVAHPSYGQGVVQAVEGRGQRAKVTVFFARFGRKKFPVDAPLEIV
jgi:hypothetical protein